MTAGSNPRLPILAGILLIALLAAGAAIMIVSRDAARPEATPAPDAARSEGMRAGAFDPPHQAPDFSLSGSDGS